MPLKTIESLRDLVGRRILFALGLLAAGAGVVALVGATLAGWQPFALLVATTSIAGGVGIIRQSRGPKRHIGMDDNQE